jgi:hypothetical protein
LLASATFVGWHFRGQGADVLHVGPLDWRYLALAGLFQLGYLAVNTSCWRATIGWYGGIDIGWLTSFRQLMMAALGKYFPGKVWGMIARAKSLSQAGVPLRQSALATINEQFLLLYASFLVCAVLWALIQSTAYAWLLAAAAVFGLFALPKLQQWAFGLRLTQRFFPENLAPDAGNVLPWGNILLLVAGYGAIWIFSGLTVAALYHAIFGGVPAFPLLARLIIANAIGISIGFFAVFSPGGLGIREAVTGGMLSMQLGAEPAVLLCLVFRLWIVAFELLGGLTLLMRERETTRQ